MDTSAVNILQSDGQESYVLQKPPVSPPLRIDPTSKGQSGGFNRQDTLEMGRRGVKSEISFDPHSRHTQVILRSDGGNPFAQIPDKQVMEMYRQQATELKDIGVSEAKITVTG